jgi:hypothetical protein
MAVAARLRRGTITANNEQDVSGGGGGSFSLGVAFELVSVELRYLF